MVVLARRRPLPSPLFLQCDMAQLICTHFVVQGSHSALPPAHYLDGGKGTHLPHSLLPISTIPNALSSYACRAQFTPLVQVWKQKKQQEAEKCEAKRSKKD